ncbi:PAS domain S-box protein [Halostella salina]|uniref:PAS domain S-box protein n=1 Tax=Halostella salina TaxID=1547897 RepID=UPI000EF7E252|nr:PAS domain S-box protein [Halostella salina]
MASEALTDSLRETLARFDRGGEPRTTSEVADSLDLGRRSTYERLERLVEHGELDTKKVGASARVWWRPGATGPPSGSASAAESVVEDVLDEAAVGVFVLDAEFDVAWINDAVQRYFGVDRKRVLGRDKRSLVRERIAPVVENTERFTDRLLSAYDDNAATERFECRVTTGEHRERRWLEHRSKPIPSGAYAGGRVELYYDITERKLTERARRQERKQFESMVDAVEEYAIFRLDPEGRVRSWNPGAERIKGYDADEIIGEHVSVFYTEEDRVSSVPERNLEAAARLGSVEEEGWRVAKDGSRFWANVTVTAIRDDDGELKGYTKVTRDMTERRQRERQVRRQRDELKRELDDVFDRIDDAFVGLDTEYRITYVSDRAAELLDRTPGELAGRKFVEVFPEVVGTRFEEESFRAMEEQEQRSFEAQYEPLDAWFETTIYPSDTGLSVYFRDVTERKERERELEQYETIVETVDDGIYALDDDARFVMVNDAFCEMAGWEREELLGRPSSTVYDDDLAGEAADRTAAVVEGDREAAVLEFDLHTRDGDQFPVEARFGPLPTSDGYGRCGVVRDVSDRLERERELRRRVRQQEVVADLGQRALEDTDVDDLMAAAAAEVAETLDTDYCKVLDLDADAEELLLRQGVGWDEGVVGEATVSAVDDDSQAAYTLASAEPVVVSDLATETRFSGPDLLTDHDVRSGISVVIGPREEPWGILGTHDTATREFSEHDVTFVQSVATVLATAIGRHRDEQVLRRQREQLAALNGINEVVREITDAAIDQSTREEIEKTVCDRLVETESYLFAWVGEVDVATQEVTVRTETGAAEYLDDVHISADQTDERGEGPTARALRTGEIQTVSDVRTAANYSPWRDTAEEYGVRSSAAIPIVHEDTVYGVLNVYAERPDAFAEPERTVVGQLGEVVGHAIAATERKRALMGDEVTELEFRIADVFDAVEADGDREGRIRIDSAVPVEDGEFLVYGNATPDATGDLETLVGAIPHWTDVTFHGDPEADDESGFELRLSDPPVLAALASIGGSVDEAVIEDGDYRMRLHLSPGADARQVIDAVQETYPTAEMVKRRQRTRAEVPDDRGRAGLEALTERQRTALEAAYHAGFFEWPRDSSGEDVAESLGVSPATFHQHLRKAEKEVLGAVLP